jgi:type IV pilus assembly protein PilA
MNRQKGFTLIELLVVIAIIGILSSVVLASLNTARNRGTNAAIKSTAASLRNQTELYFDTTGDYGTAMTAATTCPASGSPGDPGEMFFSANPDILSMIEELDSKAGATNSPTCMVTATGWALSVPLVDVTVEPDTWCVDSEGSSGAQNDTITVTGVCS